MLKRSPVAVVSGLFAFVAACSVFGVRLDDNAPLSDDASASDSGIAASGLDGAASTDAPLPIVVADADSPLCKKIVDGFEPVWALKPTWLDEQNSGGGTHFPTSAFAKFGLESMEFATANFDDVTRIGASLDGALCALHFDAWVRTAGAGDGALIVSIKLDNGSSLTLSLVSGGFLVVLEGTSQRGSPIQFNKADWHHLSVDYNPSNGKVAIDPNGFGAAINLGLALPAPRATRIDIGIMGANNGAEGPDEVLFDDVTIRF